VTFACHMICNGVHIVVRVVARELRGALEVFCEHPAYLRSTAVWIVECEEAS